MSETKGGILRSSTGVATATLLSRLLGLGRVMLEARVLGGGVVMSAWVWAFTIPNLFRRLLGEGALGTALVPMISQILEDEGKDSVKSRLTAVFGWLGVFLAILCIVIAGGAMLAQPFFSEPRYVLALQILPIVIPYAFFICLVGIACSILNTVRQFFLPALVALILNIVLLGVLSLLWYYHVSDAAALLKYMAFGVLLVGVLQLLFMTMLLWHSGMLPRISLKALWQLATLKELWALTLPGLVGASALQISLLVDRTLAIYLGDRAAPALFYSDRIVYLPIGVFAVSMGAVGLANMSRSAAKQDYDAMIESLVFSLKHLLFVCIPIAVFTLVFREYLIKTICMGGRFDMEALKATSWAMLFYALGIPAFASIKVMVTAFYARKDMKTPVRVSICCIVLNIILNLILMWPMAQGGLALATVIASFVNNAALLWLLSRQYQGIELKSIGGTVMRSVIASVAAVTACWLMVDHIPHPKLASFLSDALLPTAVCGILFLALYGAISACLRSPELRDLLALAKK